MKKSYILSVLLIMLISIVLMACVQGPLKKQKKLSSFYVLDIRDSTKLKTIVLESEKQNLREKHIENIDQLTNLINSIRYNIVSVRTFYTGYYITSVEIKYILQPKQIGFKLRFKFLNSYKLTPQKVEEDLISQQNAFLDRINYHFLNINTVTINRFIVYVEIFYYEKDEKNKINDFSMSSL